MLLALVTLLGACACVVLVAVAALAASPPSAASPAAPSSPSSPSQPSAPSSPSSPSQPSAPSSPSQPSRSGSRLPASCKITGDVFGANARVRGGIAKQNVRATYHTYSPHYDTGTLACADIVWKWPNYSQKLLTYPWTAYCLEGSAGWNPQKTCGRCLRVRNRSTGAAVIARVVDSGGCAGGAQNGLDLDVCTFNAIDGDGHGVRDGHMMVDVEEVAC